MAFDRVEYMISDNIYTNPVVISVNDNYISFIFVEVTIVFRSFYLMAQEQHQERNMLDRL